MDGRCCAVTQIANMSDTRFAVASDWSCFCIAIPTYLQLAERFRSVDRSVHLSNMHRRRIAKNVPRQLGSLICYASRYQHRHIVCYLALPVAANNISFKEYER